MRFQGVVSFPLRTVSEQLAGIGRASEQIVRPASGRTVESLGASDCTVRLRLRQPTTDYGRSGTGLSGGSNWRLQSGRAEMQGAGVCGSCLLHPADFLILRKVVRSKHIKYPNTLPTCC